MKKKWPLGPEASILVPISSMDSIDFVPPPPNKLMHEISFAY